MRRFSKIFIPLFLFVVLMSMNGMSSAASTTLVINELDYDQISPPADNAEYVEIKNVSGSAIELDPYSVVFVNGANNLAYLTVNLPIFSLAAGDYYVICGDAANVPNCDLDITPNADAIQNGSPDGVEITLAGNIVDVLSYEGTIPGHSEGAGTGTGVTEADSNATGGIGLSRCQDGADTDINDNDFQLRNITPGAANDCPLVDDPTALKINEFDYDQVGTDDAEYVELKNVSNHVINLDHYVLELVNGDLGGASVYSSFDLPDFSLAANDYFVVCANNATVPNCDLDITPDTNLIQNGAPDAIGLRLNGNLVDAVSYEGDAGAPYTEGTGSSFSDTNTDVGIGLSRCDDGVDTDNNSANFQLRNITPGATNDCPSGAVVVEIWEVQGAAHLSPYNTQFVQLNDNIVTAVRSNGFYIQTPDVRADGSNATSNGVLVFTNSAPSVVVGQSVNVVGTVSEFRPGGIADGGLTITEIVSPIITINSSGNALPAPITVGIGGRIPPSAVINDDGTGNIETSGTFDADTDGIDFYESLEAMRIQINDAIVVGATNSFGETWVVSDNGANSNIITPRGGILISSGDFNPERLQLEDTIYPGGTPAYPLLTVGDSLTSAAIGVVDYGFGNYEVLVTETFTTASANLQREVTSLTGSASELTVATFNVENLAGNAAPAEFAERADQIVNNLGSPDILVLEEIQDNNGTTNDSTTDASATLTNLASAVALAGGPVYQFQQIDPVDDADGGAPGGNIRIGFFYNSARVSFVSRAGSTSTTPNSAVCGVNGAELQYSPGRIDPTNSAFNASRKPLTGEFTFNGETVFVIGLHFNSKGGDNPLFGFNQPPIFGSEVQRVQQATIVNNFVGSLLACQPDANIVVLGDVNDFDYSTVALTLAGDDLHNLMSTLPSNERYSYVFDGNSQVLDQMMVSQNLFDNLVAYDVVHVNAEFRDQVSDHDPSLMLVQFNSAPVVTNPGDQTDAAATAVSLQIVANDADNDTLAYSATGLPAGLSIDSASGLISGTINNNAAADSPYSVVVTVEDDATPALSDTASFTWTVTTPAEPAVLTFTLVNADTDTDIGPLADGDIIDLSTLPTANLSVRANTLPADASGSVRFGLDTDSNFRTDNNAPFTLGNGSGGNYSPVTLTIGSHTLTATPYTGNNANGTAGTPLTITFEVRPQLVLGFILVNADTDTDIGPLNDGDTIDLASLPTSNLSVRAVTSPEEVGSVRFGLDTDSNYRTDNNAPYSLGGGSGGNFHPVTLSIGSHTLTATLYTRGSANGLAGTPLTITFTISPQLVSGFILVDADTDTDIMPINNGDTLDLAALPPHLNIRAVTSPAFVGSVRFGFDTDSNYRTDNNPPYSLGGGSGNNFNPLNLSVGSHTLTGTPYTGSGANGVAGTPLTISFTVEDNEQFSPADGATVSNPVTLSWNAIAGVTCYAVQVDNSPSFGSPEVNVIVVNANTLTLSTLPARTYYWRVGISTDCFTAPITWGDRHRFILAP
jgi:predicted extracellular nuclease